MHRISSSFSSFFFAIRSSFELARQLRYLGLKLGVALEREEVLAILAGHFGVVAVLPVLGIDVGHHLRADQPLPDGIYQQSNYETSRD